MRTQSASELTRARQEAIARGEHTAQAASTRLVAGTDPPEELCDLSVLHHRKEHRKGQALSDKTRADARQKGQRRTHTLSSVSPMSVVKAAALALRSSAARPADNKDGVSAVGMQRSAEKAPRCWTLTLGCVRSRLGGPPGLRGAVRAPETQSQLTPAHGKHRGAVC